MWIIGYKYKWAPYIIDDLYLEDLNFWCNGISWLRDKKIIAE